VDPLAALYEGAVSGGARRALGTFFTPPEVVEYMLEAASRLVGQPTTIIDPGAGVGAFSLAAARRWPEARIVAVDVNVVTLGLLAARAGDLLGRIDLAHEDFLDWASKRAHEEPGPRLWIGNPPYTRHQAMSGETKERARRSATRLVQSGLAGLSAYFLAVTLDALAPEDGLCYLLPGSWTDTRYGRPLRDELAGMRGREVGLIGFPSERQLFPGTRVTAMILVVGPSGTAAKAMWSMAVDIRGNRVVEQSRVPRDRPNAPAEGFGPWLWPRTGTADDDRVPLSAVGDVRRGVATGANEFFLLTDISVAGAPRAFLRPAVRSLRRVTGAVLDADAHALLGELGLRRWLLELPVDVDLESNTWLSKWADRARAAHVPDRYLAAHRGAWFSVERVEPPDLLLSPMGKRRMRAVCNAIAAVPSNAIYGIYLRPRLDVSPSALCDWLNSAEGQVSLHVRARAYGAGLFKLEPNDLRAVPIPRRFLHD